MIFGNRVPVIGEISVTLGKGVALAAIRPFRGLCYDVSVAPDLSSVVSAPYDIITPEAQRGYYERSPFNVIRLELGVEHPDDSATENRYTRAARQLAEWKAREVLTPDEQPAFYLYEEGFPDADRPVARRSIFAAVRLANWDEGIVLPHEYTLPKARADRLQLLEATRTQLSPLLAMYDDPGSIRALQARVAATLPDRAFTLAEGAVSAAATTHRLWKIADEASCRELMAAFSELQIYIADGHHRYETALAHRDRQRALGAGPEAPSEYVLMSLVETSDPGLILLPTHRLLKGLTELNPRQILRGLGEAFEVERRAISPDLDTALADLQPTADGIAFTALGLEAGYAHQLRARPSLDLASLLPDVPLALRKVDTLVLQRVILEGILGLDRHEAEAGERIQYTRDPREAIRAYESGEAQLIFFLKPTPIAQIREVTRAGARMPQKTTYFYPKPVTGLIFFDQTLPWS